MRVVSSIGAIIKLHRIVPIVHRRALEGPDVELGVFAASDEDGVLGGVCQHFPSESTVYSQSSLRRRRRI